jgi:AAA domain
MPSTLEGMVIGEKLTCIFKGDPGTGKTIAAASFSAGKEDVYFFDLDQRIRPLVLHYSNAELKDYKKHIKFDTYTGETAWGDLCSKLDSLISYNPYGTLCMDSLTALSRMLISLMLIARGEAGKQKLKRGGVALTQIEDYSGEANGINQVIDALRVISGNGTKCNIIMTAHVIQVSEKSREGKISLSRYLVNSGAKKTVAEIPAYFDEAWHFDVAVGPTGRPQYRIITRNVGSDWAKTALPIPDEIDFTAYPLNDAKEPNEDFSKRHGLLYPIVRQQIGLYNDGLSPEEFG